jgi:SAM-dependent methyltransferase
MMNHKGNRSLAVMPVLRRLRRRFRSSPSPTPFVTPSRLRMEIERFSFFEGLVLLAGCVTHPDRTIASVTLQVGDASASTLCRRNGRFTFEGRLALDDIGFSDPRLLIAYADGSDEVITQFIGGTLNGEAGHRVFASFLQSLRNRPPGRVLELGARARSGITRRQLIPPGWDYLGLDIVAGENVDVVGDAHELARLFAGIQFDAIFSISVFEHLAMPWKVAVEMNRVLVPGGLVFTQSHQSWPMHELPWDFWRFSEQAWAALFNPATGFEIVERGLAEPLDMVARRWHPAVHFSNAPAYGLSSVLARKINETRLDWDVDLSSVTVGNYPC